MANARALLLLWIFALLGSTTALGDDPPARGRDPFIFRLALDDRPRMCVAALRSDLFLAYDPLTCGLTKAFGGGVEYRGKVFDFSQQTSAARAPIYFADEAVPCAVTKDSPGLVLDRVRLEDAFVFESSGSTLELPPIDTRRFDLLMLTFEEKSRKGPLRVEVLDDTGAVAQWFDSTLHGSDDNAFQANTKNLHVVGSNVRIRFRQEHTEFSKALRGIKVHGAPRVWSVTVGEKTLALEPRYLGYSVAGAGVGRFTLQYALPLPAGGKVDVTESPEAISVSPERVGIERRFTIAGLPAGATLALRLAGEAKRQTFRVTGNGKLQGGDHQEVLEIGGDGELTLEQWWDR